MSEPLKGGFSSFTSGTPFNLPSASGTQPPVSLFGNATPAANMGSATQNTSAPNASGAGGSSGTSLFANLQANPPGGSLFGGGTAGAPSTSTSTTTGSGSNLFTGFGTGSATPATAQNTSTAPAASSTPSFGGNLFGSKPAEQSASTGTPGTSTTPQPSGATGVQPASTTTSTTTNLFGKPAESSTSAPSSTPAASSGSNLFGGNLFGKKPDTPANSSTTPSTTTPAPTLFAGFGAKKDETADKDKPKDGTAMTATPSTTGGLFGQPPANKDTSSGIPGASVNLFGQKPAEKKDTPAGEKKDGTVTPSPAPLGATTSDKSAGTGTPTPAGISVPPPSMLRGKTIEEIVNKWSSELETHVREFTHLAGEIAVWDRALIDNGNTIAALLQHVSMAEREQNDIEQSLKHIEDQQKELASTLEVYEKSAGEIFDAQGGGLRALDVGPADAERDKHYTLAAELNANLDDLSRSLLQMIESVNTLSEDGGVDTERGKTKGDAPLEQIAQILASHLESLQWIDGTVKEVESKVTDVERLVRDASVNGSRATSGVSSLSGSVNGARSSGMKGSRGFGLR